MTSECEICNGTRHIPTDKGWLKCSCVSRVQAEIRLANLPVSMRVGGLDRLPNSTIKSTMMTVLSRLSSKAFPKKFVVLVGRVDEIVSSSIYDAAIGGIDSRRVSFQHCANAYFHDRVEWASIVGDSSRLLFVSLGGETFNSASVSIIQEVIQDRRWRDAYTVLLVEKSIAVLAAGKSTKEIGQFLSDTSLFKEVLI